MVTLLMLMGLLLVCMRHGEVKAVKTVQANNSCCLCLACNQAALLYAANDGGGGSPAACKLS